MFVQRQQKELTEKTKNQTELTVRTTSAGKINGKEKRNKKSDVRSTLTGKQTKKQINKRNWTFAIFQRKNKRQSAVSLLKFSYDLVFNPPRDKVQPNST